MVQRRWEVRLPRQRQRRSLGAMSQHRSAWPSPGLRPRRNIRAEVIDDSTPGPGPGRLDASPPRGSPAANPSCPARSTPPGHSSDRRSWIMMRRGWGGRTSRQRAQSPASEKGLASALHPDLIHPGVHSRTLGCTPVHSTSAPSPRETWKPQQRRPSAVRHLYCYEAASARSSRVVAARSPCARNQRRVSRTDSSSGRVE